MAEKQSSFSIDDFIGEIEKAEDDRVNKRLPQERLKNKRALDNAARRAAEAAGNPGKLVPKKLKVQKNPALEQAEAEGLIIDTGKGKRSAATGMSLKSPKSKANSVIRPTNLEGFGEQEQAGFGHLPSAKVRGAGTGSRSQPRRMSRPTSSRSGTTGPLGATTATRSPAVRRRGRTSGRRVMRPAPAAGSRAG